jgi:hypothetical protein
VTEPRCFTAVSWCMPPALFPRSIQVARLLKGLRPLGWRSTVVTAGSASRPGDEVLDPALAEIYGGEYGLLTVDTDRVDPESGALWERWTQRLRGEDGLSDEELWVKRAADRAARAIGASGSRTLVTFAQPWRDHLVGLAVARRHRRLRWIAHFSDPWVDSIYDADLPADVRERDRQHEARVIERADAVVFTTTHAADLVMAKYPPAWRQKSSVVSHAMDEDVIPLADAVPVAARGTAFRIAHVGNLFRGRRTANMIFDALAAINRTHALRGRLELILAGEGNGLYEARARVFELALEGIVTFQPRTPYLQSLATMRQSDLLLLIDAPARTNVFLPSKVADYVMMRRPILAITPAIGASADIMRRLGHDIVAPGDVPAIAAALERGLQRHEAGRAVPRPPADPALSLQVVAPAFAAVLESVSGPRA